MEKRCRFCRHRFASMNSTSVYEDDDSDSDSCSYKTCPSDPIPSLEDLFKTMKKIESRVSELVLIVKKMETNWLGSLAIVEEEKHLKANSSNAEEIGSYIEDHTGKVKNEGRNVGSQRSNSTKQSAMESYSTSNRGEWDRASVSSSVSRSYSMSDVSSSSSSSTSTYSRSTKRIARGKCSIRARKRSKSRVGMFRQLKNKLGFIVHHLHHHHHHDGGNEKKAVPVKKESKWRLGKKNFSEKERVTSDKKILRSRAVVVRKSQLGHFHALVEGLMKHFTLSKMVKRHRHGVCDFERKLLKKKMSKRVKVGFMGHKKRGNKNLKGLK